MTPFTVGASLGGLVIASVRAIVIAVMGPKSNDQGAIAVYFGVSMLGNFVDLVMNLQFFQSSLYYEKVWPYELVKSNPMTKLSETDVASLSTIQSFPIDSYVERLKEAHRSVFPYHLYLLVNYSLSIALFPAMVLKRHYQLPGAWPLTILTMCYSMGDALGKAFCYRRNLFNAYTVLFTLLFRLYFLWSVVLLTFPLTDWLFNNDLHAYVNLLVFGMCGGLVTSTAI